MLEFKIEPGALNETRDAKSRLVLWSIVLLLFAISASIYALGFLGLLSVNSDLRWLAWLSVPTILSAGIGTLVLAFRDGLRRAEREMIFVLDDNGIVRKREGFPEERIDFPDVDTLGEERRWLVVKSSKPVRTIAIPKDVEGFATLRAELAKYGRISTPKDFSILRAVPTVASLALWGLVLWSKNPSVVKGAGAVALMLLAWASVTIDKQMRRSPKRLIVWISLGSVWVAAILLVYFKVIRAL